MGAKISRQHGKHRHVSKNMLTPMRRKDGIPYNIKLKKEIAAKVLARNIKNITA